MKLVKMLPDDDLLLCTSGGRRVSPQVVPLSILRVSEGLDVRTLDVLAKDVLAKEVIEALWPNPKSCDLDWGVGCHQMR